MYIKFYQQITFFLTVALLLFSQAFAAADNQTHNQKVLAIKQWLTSNGVPVYFVSRKNLPIIDVAIAFNAGSGRDGNLSGLANFTANMIDEGTQKLTASDIANQIDQLGANFNTVIDQDMTVFSLRTLTKPEILPKAVSLFTQLLTESTFPVDAFNRNQKIMISNINAEQEDPSTVALQAVYKTLYGDYPYAHPVAGDKNSIMKIRLEDLKQFYKTYYVASNAVIGIVGNLDLDQAKKLSEQITKNLPKGTPAPAVATPTTVAAKTQFIKYPVTQSYISMGQMGIKRGDPAFFPLMIGNYILGGGATSELFHNVRELQGLSYQVASYFIPLKSPGPFVIILQTRTEKTKEAISATINTFKQFISQGPSENELINAKKFINGNFPLRIDSNSDILNSLVLIGFYHLPLDYLDTYRANVNAVTANDIKLAFQKLIDPKSLAIVVVGRNNITNGTKK